MERNLVSSLHVLTTVTGSPDLILAQLNALARFFPFGTTVTVVDDSRTRAHFSNSGEARLSRRIRDTVTRLGARYERFPQHLHFRRRTLFPNSRTWWSRDASLRTANAIQYGLSQIPATSRVVILDADMVPVAPFDADSYFNRSPIWYLPQQRETPTRAITYPWNGIFFIDQARIGQVTDMNWDCDIVEGIGLDTGGAMRTWLATHQESAAVLTGLHSGRWNWQRDFSDAPSELQAFLEFDAKVNGDKQFCELFESTFLHLRAGGNWNIEMRDVFAQRRSLFAEAIQANVDRAV